MRVSIVAGLIVAVHVAVIGSVVMTQGCASTQRGAGSTAPVAVDPAPAPVLPPSSAMAVPAVVQPVTFPAIQPPVAPAPLKTSIAAENVYVIKAGDMLSKIAVAHGITARELAELNKITDPNKIRAGQKLILPDHSKPSQSQPAEKAAAAAKTEAKAVAAGAGEYVVKSGDSLSKIASAQGVKMKDLMAANNITDANRIRIGQKLAIPGAKAAEKKESAKKPEEKSEVKAAEEKAPEKKAKEKSVAPLPAPVPEAPVPFNDPEMEAMLDYTVQDGDTAEGIARLFVVRKDDILRVNNIPAGADVRPGQKIKIPPSSL
jgi:LysM repeat protein